MEIVGQQHVKKILKNIILSQNIPHSYIFYGPGGTGKKQAAISFAKALNCSNVQDGQGCGVCNSCRRIDSSNYADVKIIEPEGTSFKIDQVRYVKTEISYRSYEGGWKVFILLNMDLMTVHAANSLLKILEEPPEKSATIMLCENIKGMLPTIVSRCQLLEFRRVPQEELEQFLITNAGVDKTLIKPLAELSKGSPYKALDLVNSDVMKLRKELIDGICDIIEKSSVENMDFISKYARDKDNVYLVIDILSSWYRDVLVYMETKSGELIMNTDRLNDLRNYCESTDKAKAYHILSQLNELKKTVWLTRKSLNLHYAFQELILRMCGEIENV